MPKRRSITWWTVSSSVFYRRAAEELRHNQEQWAAYESQGHCVVLAGPGSGKTRTLIIKMARMLLEDVAEPRGIACITFSNECARELEDRLSTVGIEPGGRVFVGTVHSFSLTQIVVPYAKSARLGLPDDFRVATRAEQASAMRETLANRSIRSMTNGEAEDQLLRYRRSILNRESPAWLQTDGEMAALVEAYESNLRRLGVIDFDDMPLLALRALRTNPWLQRAILAKYPVLVVDEYQDLGVALHKMVLGLCFSTGIRLFAVGDIDQSIYGFNGARPDLLQSLSERPDVEAIRLKLNYRYGNRIVAASSAALGQDRGYRAIEGARQGEVFIHPTNGSYEFQADYVVRSLIPQALARHPELGYGNVAVLYSAAWLGDYIATAASENQVPFVRTDSRSLYPRNSRLMQWLELCAKWCCGGWKSGALRFSTILRNARRLFSDSLSAEPVALEFQAALTELLWNSRAPEMDLHVWLDSVLQKVIEPFASARGGLSDELDILAGFMKRVEPGGDCEGMLLGSLAGDGGPLDRITLSSLHSAKGKEFDLVFMFGMDRRYFPHPKSTDAQVEEARRSFYVGFTRARAEIHLVHSLGGASTFVADIEDYLSN